MPAEDSRWKLSERGARTGLNGGSASAEDAVATSIHPYEDSVQDLSRQSLGARVCRQGQATSNEISMPVAYEGIDWGLISPLPELGTMSAPGTKSGPYAVIPCSGKIQTYRLLLITGVQTNCFFEDVEHDHSLFPTPMRPEPEHPLPARRTDLRCL